MAKAYGLDELSEPRVLLFRADGQLQSKEKRGALTMGIGAWKRQMFNLWACRIHVGY